MKLKHWLLSFIFIVTWNEYALKTTQPCPQHPCCDAVYYPPCIDGDIYTVETTTHTIKLATQRDVDLFVGKDVPAPFSNDYSPPLMNHIDGIISKDAFNIQVKEEK